MHRQVDVVSGGDNYLHVPRYCGRVKRSSLEHSIRHAHSHLLPRLPDHRCVPTNSIARSSYAYCTCFKGATENARLENYCQNKTFRAGPDLNPIRHRPCSLKMWGPPPHKFSVINVQKRAMNSALHLYPAKLFACENL